MSIYLTDEPFAKSALAYAKEDQLAKVVLLQDAVYLARSTDFRGQIYVMAEDVVRRGIQSTIPANVHIIEYSDLIDMMEKDRVVNFL